jgi:pimeloyl-ACP methyl ester carboxylesterase
MRSLALLLTLVTSGVAAKPIPIDSLARKPAINSVSMSSDGEQLVALIAAPGTDYKETALATWDLENLDQEPVITASADKMKFIGAYAMKAGKILVTGRQEWTGPLAGCGEGNYSGSTATFVFKNYLTDAKHSEFEEAFTRGSQKIGTSEQVERCLEIAGSARLVNTLPLDPTKVIIRQIDSLSLQGNYFLYDLKTERSKLLLRAGPDAQPGLFHPRDGRLLIRVLTEPKGRDEYEQQVLIHNEATDEFEVHDKLTTNLSERYTVRVVGVDEATGQFYVLTDLFSEQVQAWTYDPKSRSFGSEPLVAHGKYSIAGLVFGTQPSNFNKLIGFSISGPSWETTYVDADMRAIHEGLKQAFPDQLVNITSYNDDLSKVLFTTSSGSHPGAYRLLVDRKEVKTLGRQRPWIDSNNLGEQRWITYTARDGLEIPGILDLPPGWKKEDGPLPTIIHPHGGPWGRDYMGWDYSNLVPFFTSRGYAVMRPQFRGSTGLGRTLWLAGDAEWGKTMQDDKDDGAAWLVEQGIADRDRIAIFGYSYGGFAAAAAVVRPNSPYQCAISGAPVTDLARLGTNWSSNRLQRILQGKTVTGMDPMDNTDKASLPVLLFVGDRDVRTPAWHAKNFYKAVKDTVPAKLEIIEDMPHQLPWYYSHYEIILNLMEDYLAKDCGPGGL